MSSSFQELQLTTDHAVPVSPVGGTAIVTVQAGSTVYYSSDSDVSSTFNEGSILATANQSFTSQTWLRSAGFSTVLIETDSQSQVPSSVVSVSSAGGIAAWAPSTVYALNVLVTNGGSTYICKLAHTSGGSFSGVGTNWGLFGGAAAGALPSIVARLAYPSGLQAVADIGTNLNQSVSAGPGSPFTSRVQYKSPPWGISDLKITVAAWIVNASNAGEANLGNAMTHKAAIEYNGAFYPVWWPTGTRSIALDDGGEATSLPVGVEIPANSTFFVRLVSTYTGSYPSNNQISFRAGSYQVGDLADGTGALANSLGTSIANPVAITATPTGTAGRTVVILGDSIDQGFNAPNNVSWAKQAFGSGYGIRCLAMQGETGSIFNTSHARRGRLLAGADYATDGYGINDLRINSVSLATLQAAKLLTWGLASQRGLAVFSRTILPNSNSTDSWATVGNQSLHLTTGVEAVRVGFNDWLRGGAPIVAGAAVAVGTVGALLAGTAGHPLTGYIETADTVETARNSGLWKAPGYTTDGLHPTSATAVTAMAGAVNLALFT